MRARTLPCRLPLAVAGLLLVTAPAAGQGGAPGGEPGTELSAYLMTMGVGQEVWERFGHNFIGIRDRRTGTDRVYNYGVFSFRQQNFLLHFIQGRMTYWMAADDGDAVRRDYRRYGRSIWVQELDLTPAQRVALRDFLEWNAREENRYYRYDYYRDNCSTRVRDALDRVLGGAIRRQTGSVPAHTSYRLETLRLTANNLPIWTGLLAAEGQPVDRAISAWEDMFLPLALRELVRGVKVTSADGTEVPLVASEDTVFESGVPVPVRPPSWLPGFLAVGVTLGGLLVVLARVTRPGGRGLFGVLAGLWGLLAGLAGLVMSLLWLLTDHAITARNENLLQISPLLLLVAVLLPFARTAPRWRVLRRITTTVAALSLLGLLLKVLPWFHQSNLTIIALALPVNLGLAWGVRRLTPAPDAPA